MKNKKQKIPLSKQFQIAISKSQKAAKAHKFMIVYYTGLLQKHQEGGGVKLVLWAGDTKMGPDYIYYIINSNTFKGWDRRGRHRIVVGFRTTCAMSAYYH